LHQQWHSDRSGFSVSSAGDVNGDGLDDLIVGAKYADLSDKLNTGKSYIIFGKTDTNAVNLIKLGDNSQYAIDYLGDKVRVFASAIALRLMALLLVLPNTT
jgi:hypothetical protein